MMPGKASAIVHPLTSQLANRLNDPGSLDEPYIIQDRVPQTQSRHVVVIWDAWASMKRPERSRIIADAFEEAGVKDAIRVSMGLTQQEAMEMGFLPYHIIANWKKTDGEAILQSLKQAIQGTPGIHVYTGSSVQLRYPTLDQAQQAYRLLSTAVPGPYWAIVNEIGSTE